MAVALAGRRRWTGSPAPLVLTAPSRIHRRPALRAARRGRRSTGQPRPRPPIASTVLVPAESRERRAPRLRSTPAIRSSAHPLPIAPKLELDARLARTRHSAGPRRDGRAPCRRRGAPARSPRARQRVRRAAEKAPAAAQRRRRHVERAVGLRVQLRAERQQRKSSGDATTGSPAARPFSAVDLAVAEHGQPIFDRRPPRRAQPAPRPCRSRRRTTASPRSGRPSRRDARGPSGRRRRGDRRSRATGSCAETGCLASVPRFLDLFAPPRREQVSEHVRLSVLLFFSAGTRAASALAPTHRFPCAAPSRPGRPESGRPRATPA